MKLEQQLLSTGKAEKACIWELFQAEERLWDIEAELLEDLHYYQGRIRSMGNPDTTADTALLNIYRNHLRRIQGLLSRLPSQHGRTATSRA